MTNGAPAASVRRATPSDDGEMVAALVRAYRDDPIMNWAFPAGERRERGWAIYFELMLNVYHPYGAVFTTDDRRSCAMWAPPGKWQVGLGTKLRHAPNIVRMLGFRRLGRGLEVMQRMEREHPREPHWYLNLLGVDPALHGRGIGSALLRTGLELCDREGVGAYLETSNPRNLSLYRRHGFELRKTVDFGAATPSYWLMWRAARGDG